MKRFALFWTLMLICIVSVAGNVTGRVFLRDTTVVPGDYVMVYSKDEGLGTQSDENGYFSIEINVYGTVKLEISRIGYTTLFLDVDTRYDIDLGDIILDPQVLMLTSAFVTPEGMTSSEYILSRLWRQSRENKEKKSDYQCEISYNLATHEIPMVAGVMPGIMTGMVKFVATMKGFGPLVRYCLEEDEFSASARLDRVVRRGKTTDYNKKLLSGHDLPPKVQKNILDVFSLFFLFDILYSTATSWGENFSNKHKFTHAGTYEYGDKLVDVIQWQDSRVRAEVHIVEDDWGILKAQLFSKEGEVIRCEARDRGNGVYMPVSCVLKPALTMVRADQIPGFIEEIKNIKQLNKATKERSIKVLEAHLGEDFNPYIAIDCSIRYVN